MAKYLIVNADDFGMCHSTNLAVKNLFEAGRIKSTTVITVAGWAKEAANMIKEQPELIRAGVHITHTAEWETYRWHGFLDIPELQDKDRMFPKTTEEALTAPIELRIAEAKEQIKWLENQGVYVTHLDNHMRTCKDKETAILEICKEKGIGYRYPRLIGRQKEADEFIKEYNIVTPDYLNYTDGKVVSDNTTYESHSAMYIHMLKVMKDGINEWFTHPSLETDETKAIAPDWRIRVNDYRFLMSDEFVKTLEEENITLIGYEDIERIRKEG